MSVKQNRAIVIPITWSSRNYWEGQRYSALLHIGVFNEGTRSDFASFWLLQSHEGIVVGQISGRNGEEHRELSQNEVDDIYPLISEKISTYFKPIPIKLFSTVEGDNTSAIEYEIKS